MKYVLDTHTFLWFSLGSERLSESARLAIEDDASDNLLSMASIWEMAIKFSLGRLDLTMEFDDFIDRGLTNSNSSLLSIDRQQLSLLAKLEYHHRDPFDRMIVAQCLSDGISLIGCDKAFDDYNVKRIW